MRVRPSVRVDKGMHIILALAILSGVWLVQLCMRLLLRLRLCLRWRLRWRLR
jgi:hypothetical protein